MKVAVQKLFSDSSAGLSLVEKRVKDRFVSDAEGLTEISDYLLSLGGKRIRPLLALSIARLFRLTDPIPDLIDAAAGIELIHMATLLHDDIIDESSTRRHQTSAYRKFGLAPSLLAGDFLLARAFGLCSHLDEFVVTATEQACVELTEGELLEGTIVTGRKLSLEEYLTVVEKKTASLFALAAAIGSHLAGAETADVDAIKSFGRCAGVTFQMADDILDVTAEEDLLGKPSGTDLRQKTPSLINVLWLNSGDQRASAFFDLPSPTMEQAKEAANLLKESAVIESAKQIAASHANQAKNYLFSLKSKKIDETVLSNLEALIDFTLERSS